MKLLHIDASILNTDSVSRQLSAAIVKRFIDANPGADVIRYDLGAEPIGHLTGAHLAAAEGHAPATPELQKDLARGQKALDDFLAADVIVIGAPMYNFSVPSQLKAWIDRLSVAGKTFRYTESGAEGLVHGKRLIVASSRGGFYGPQTPAAFLDHQESYLRGLFGFLGITDVSFIRAEGVARGPDQRKAAIESAIAEATKLAA
jgi:FMN-dependent NADH-azoreductase